MTGVQTCALPIYEFDNGVEGLVKPFLEDVRFPEIGRASCRERVSSPV